MPSKRTRGFKSRKSRNKNSSRKEHLRSRVETTITLKSKHKKRESYPIEVSDIFNEASIGSDTDIRMVGYTIRVEFATGNQTQTVSVNLGHSGDWVRRGTSADSFNQVFQTRALNKNTAVFQKGILPRAEREFLSPHKSKSYVDLQVDDPCGVIPGCTVKITADIYFIRPAIPTLLKGADDDAVDLYEDQDVNGSQPAPPATVSDVPASIVKTGERFTTKNAGSPFKYVGDYSDFFTVTIGGTNTVNKIGEFQIDPADLSNLQTLYAGRGYDGSIVYTQ